MANVVALIPAAGQGKRMGNQVNKQFLCLAGLPILVHTLTVFERHPRIDAIVLVCREEEQDFCRKEIVEKFNLKKVVAVVAGGDERQQSVYNGLQALPPDTELVVVHDGARPFVSAEVIDRTLEGAFEALERGACAAAIAAVPVKDTIKEAGPGGVVAGTPDRTRLWQVQTPQVFAAGLLREAHDQARRDGFAGTDDGALVEHLGRPVQLVPGTYENIKITTAEDLAIGEAILKRRSTGEATLKQWSTGGPAAGQMALQAEKGAAKVRVGMGYDVHRLVKGRALILGGVEIPYHLGLLGHSDADVLLHAIADAILGAVGAGDIGRHFPDTDPAFKGISSLLLLRRVAEIAARKGYEPGNVDAVIVAQKPKLAPFIPEMIVRTAEALGTAGELVNIKATTTEGLGFAGTGEGIAAYATVSVYKV